MKYVIKEKGDGFYKGQYVTPSGSDEGWTPSLAKAMWFDSISAVLAFVASDVKLTRATGTTARTTEWSWKNLTIVGVEVVPPKPVEPTLMEVPL